jgi:hypothetical protein
MGIVFITIPGEAKRAFANTLHEKTDGNVDLIIVQKPKRMNVVESVLRLASAVGWLNLPRELWHGLLLRFDGTKEALEYFRAHSPLSAGEYVPPFIEVDSVNSDKVYELLKRISPDLLVIWGSTVLEDRILKTAKKAINLHLGYCPHYRGALANQHAVSRGDMSRIGATIHYVEKKVDAGEILAVVAADHLKSPREVFRDLNDRVMALYLDIATRLHQGEHIPGVPQDTSRAENFLLKHWTPSMRHGVGQKMLAWERAFVEENLVDRTLSP